MKVALGVPAPPCPRCASPVEDGARFCSRCGASVTSSQDNRSIPEKLQSALGTEYQVLGELGRGGFAVVYSVRDTRLNRYLAVKVMRPELVASKMVAERFRREAQYVAQLDHPNILSVTFAGEGEGLLYYAMPKVRGKTLREILKRSGPFAIPDFLRVFTDVARGLDHAHRNNLVPRDVKPGNIMLEESGRALLLDFGIAKALSAQGGRLSVTGQVIGSVEYMSPEQAGGATTIDARSDIYSLGVVGFEMLAGQPPFDATTVQQFVTLHLSAAPPDIQALRPEVPAPIAAAINRCLEKNPAERWGTAMKAAEAAGVI